MITPTRWLGVDRLGATTGARGVNADLEGAFPSLAADSYTVASPKTQAYNCVAWAAGDASRSWEPGMYWPGPAGDDLAALTRLFAALGYVPRAGVELEPGHEKVALYADDQGNWAHAARQLPDGWWTSKLGPEFECRKPIQERGLSLDRSVTALERSDLKLIIDGKRREVALRTPHWF